MDAAAPIRTLIVEVYFPSAEENGLVAEAREIFATSAPGDRAKQIVADLGERALSKVLSEAGLRSHTRFLVIVSY